jgi:hypothetical protein
MAANERPKTPPSGSLGQDATVKAMVKTTTDICEVGR